MKPIVTCVLGSFFFSQKKRNSKFGAPSQRFPFFFTKQILNNMSSTETPTQTTVNTAASDRRPVPVKLVLLGK